jgi:hypothetical protein
MAPSFFRKPILHHYTDLTRRRCVSTEEIVKIIDLNVYYDLKRPLSRRNKATKTV